MKLAKYKMGQPMAKYEPKHRGKGAKGSPKALHRGISGRQGRLNHQLPLSILFHCCSILSKLSLKRPIASNNLGDFGNNVSLPLVKLLHLLIDIRSLLLHLAGNLDLFPHGGTT
ncbi:hypothetical protein PRUPE_8G058400 [Prunus persica]|uniref:Uncharacterized protein n=1 Tax=Prunus persica TaxID=3760 RepID=M5XB04_PRUPE|nr:hypothetical protein PRUPE_8G058400 [Prunus persica]